MIKQYTLEECQANINSLRQQSVNSDGEQLQGIRNAVKQWEWYYMQAVAHQHAQVRKNRR